MSQPSTFNVDKALKLATYSAPSWNGDGSQVGYQRFSDGETTFVARPIPLFDESALGLDAPSDEAAHLGPDCSAHDWRPGHPTTVAVVRDGDVVLFDSDAETTEQLSTASSDHSSPSWHPDGDVLAYVRERGLWLHDILSGTTHQVTDDVAELFGPTPVKWHPDGRYVATLTGDDDLSLTVFELDVETFGEVEAEYSDTDDVGSSPIAWERSPLPEEGIVVDTFEWVGDYLVYTADSIDGTDRTYHAILVDDDLEPHDVGTPILSEHDERGLSGATLEGHESGRLAVVAPLTGHYHLSVVDVESRVESLSADGGNAGEWATTGGNKPELDGLGVSQITSGDFEARGDALDAPAWDDTGDRLAYVTNEHDVGERRLHVATLCENGDDDGDIVESVQTFDDVDGNTVYPTWGDGRIACLRSGRTTPADVHVFDPESAAARRASVGHDAPETLSWFPDPEPVSFESSRDGETVHGYLYAPPNAAAGEDRPAVIWTHGGPVRQMRRGFHHMRSYGFFHVFNHVLVDRGYVVLELNYRGGIGYGKNYEMGIHEAIGETDVGDCVDAAAFLRNHETVGDRIGFWGLSYGGFLANAVATMTDSVDCAVNFAGIWDWRDWVRYAASLNWGARRFQPLFGGHPDNPDPAVEERYHVGSPGDHVEGLDTPLFALHGTTDPNVPFAQMDDLVADLVDRGDDFEMAYYPDEDHMFQQSATWRDAIARVLPFFETHLKR